MKENIKTFRGQGDELNSCYKHRLSGQTIDDLTPLVLTDIVSGMTARANGVVTVMQSSLSAGGFDMDSGSMISALESISCEIEDIRNIVHHFYKVSGGD